MEQKTQTTQFAPVFEFRQADFPQHLHLNDGTLYVEASTIGKIKAALEAGYAVYGEGCNGRVFVWPAEDGYKADHFYVGPATLYQFEAPEEAADFAAELCE